MKLFITTQGDPSVGIYGADITVDGLYPSDEEDREFIRKSFTEVVKEVVDDKIADAHFEDECPDCTSMLKDGKCLNKTTCPTGMYEHEHGGS